MNQYIITEDMVLWVEARYGGGNKIGVLRSILYNPQEICPYLKDEWDNADDVNANQNPCCPTIVTGLSKRYHCTYNPQAEREEWQRASLQDSERFLNERERILTVEFVGEDGTWGIRTSTTDTIFAWFVSEELASEYIASLCRKNCRNIEREKVLDDFINKIVSSRFELDGEIVVRMSDVRVIREELRKGGE